MASAPAPESHDPRKWHKHFAAKFFNRTWELLEQEDRTPEEDQEMLEATFASRAHWRKVGEPVNFAIGDWQISRVFVALDALDLAEQYAETSRAYCMDYGLSPFYHAYSYEALARAVGNAGRFDDARRYLGQAEELATNVEDGDERDLLLTDLKTVPVGNATVE